MIYDIRTTELARQTLCILTDVSTQIWEENIERERNYELIDDFVALTGPSHAEEVINQLLTTICAVSNNKKAAKVVQSLFNNNKYIFNGHDM